MIAHYSGTVIIAMRFDEMIYIGVDSKIIVVGNGNVSAPPENKIHVENNVVFAHAGIFRDTSGQFNIREAAVKAIEKGGMLNEIVDRFVADVKPKICAAFKEIREFDVAAFAKHNRADIIFASNIGGVAAMDIVTFNADVLYPTEVTVIDTRTRCPGSCDPNNALVTLGVCSESDKFMKNNQGTAKSDPIKIIEEAIGKQGECTPDSVALPATIISISRDSIKREKLIP